MIDRLKRIINDHESTQLELHLGLTTFLWGFLLALPSGNFTGSRAWRMMAVMLPETAWAVIAMVIGLSCLVGVLSKVTRITVALRLIGVRLQALWWTFVLVTIFVGTNGESIGIGINAMLMIASILVFWRLQRYAK